MKPMKLLQQLSRRTQSKEKELECYRNSVTENPENTNLLIELLICLIDFKKTKEALSRIDIFLKNNLDSRIWTIRAVLLRELNRDTEALFSIEQSLKLNFPEKESRFDGEILYHRCAFLEQVGKVEEAFEDAQKLCQIVPDNFRFLILQESLRRKLQASIEEGGRKLDGDSDPTVIIDRL